MSNSTPSPFLAATLRSGKTPGVLHCEGAWQLAEAKALEARIAACLQDLTLPLEITIDTQALSALDTSGGWLLHRLRRDLEAVGHRVHFTGLRPEFAALLDLIALRTAPAPTPTPPLPGVLTRIGRAAWESGQGALGLLSFLGASTLAMARALRHPRRMRWRAIAYNLQTAGVAALPITGLLSFLLGIVIAYQGAEQLRRVGANLYIADLVGLSILRELSPLITAIIIAGRSGSAYAAQIGTLKVTEEIDALRTIGIGPFDLLVLPKLIALIIALPLLTVYTDVMGILGGMVMAQAQLDVGFTTFINRLDDAVSLTSFMIGIGKAPVFAIIIALVGCYQGFQVNGSAESVGRQTTLSVVQSIFLVILVDALFSIAFSWLKL